ncbi:hypothetical protein VYU27_008989 [Nannochloropsis oceanica]
MLHTQAEAARVEKVEAPDPSPSSSLAGVLYTEDGRSFPYHECVWCTEGQPAPWLQDTGLALDEKGFVAVDDHLQSISHPSVFAGGDICSMVRHPRPKAGVFAVRAGPPLLENIKRALRGERLVRYTPQSTFLSLISTGDTHAVASKGHYLALEGAWLWALKDWIDRKFMRMYQDLPPMPPPGGLFPPPSSSFFSTSLFASLSSSFSSSAAARHSSPDDNPASSSSSSSLYSHPMRCGGCGSKVGASILSRVLAKLDLPLSHREDILMGVGDDAAVLLPPAPPILQVQTLDFFRAFSPRFDPFIFGQIAANHALSDCHAMNAQPRTALALVVVPLAATENITEALLVQLLAGAAQVLNAAGCALVGGHTSEGSELSLGFSITGEASPSHLLYKSKTKRERVDGIGPLCVRAGHPTGWEGRKEEGGGEKAGERNAIDAGQETGARAPSSPSSPSLPPSICPSYVLLLTKALGTGTLLAAEGQGKGKARWEEGAVASMLQSNANAAKILWEVGQATAATDVTGFGLVGHLGEMIKGGMGEGESEGGNEQGGVRVRLSLPSLAALQGAEACFAKDITSSLAPANEHHAQSLLYFPSDDRPPVGAAASATTTTTAKIKSHPKYPLLFDPQTAGGLLATVVPERVEATMVALRAAGYGAACVIGEVWRVEKGGDGEREGKIELVLDEVGCVGNGRN